MSKGKVKWFSNARGYGFILGEGTERDIFVHHSSIQMDGYRTLSEGDPVQFDLVEGPKGPKAENVSRAEAPQAAEAPPAGAEQAAPPA
jgi:CspA family cold shock protein